MRSYFSVMAKPMKVTLTVNGLGGAGVPWGRANAQETPGIPKLSMLCSSTCILPPTSFNKLSRPLSSPTLYPYLALFLTLRGHYQLAFFSDRDQLAQNSTNPSAWLTFMHSRNMPPRGSEGYDFTPILTHYLFLFTTILALVRPKKIHSYRTRSYSDGLQGWLVPCVHLSGDSNSTAYVKSSFTRFLSD